MKPNNTFDNRLLPLLAANADAWLNPASAVRLKAVPALQLSTGLPGRLVERALDAVFGAMTADKLESYLASLEPRGPAFTRQTVLHIAPGNVFTAWLHGAAISLLLGHRAWIKPSLHEPVFPRLWSESLQPLDSELADRIAVVPWSNDLRDKVDAVVAYGSDESLQALRAEFSTQAFAGYGHKFSVAIMMSSACRAGEWPAWRDRLASDIEPFHLAGCLSPQVVYWEKDFLALHDEWWTGPAAPQRRAFARLSSLLETLAFEHSHLSCVGVGGSPEELHLVRRFFEIYPGIRVCPVGDMQRPPLQWRNGGLDLGRFLLRFSSHGPIAQSVRAAGS